MKQFHQHQEILKIYIDNLLNFKKDIYIVLINEFTSKIISSWKW